MIEPAITGFLTSFSLILAIGAQNSLVLRQGLARSHVFYTCLFCAVSDAFLITMGVAGFATIAEYFPSAPSYLAFLGALFLVGYGLMRLWDAYQGQYTAELAGRAKPLNQALLILFAVTWLNPHVYLDTLGLIGAVSTQYTTDATKLAFTLGAIAASLIFFFSLGYGARYLAPLFTDKKMWRSLDIAIAIVMFSIAFGLMTADIH